MKGAAAAALAAELGLGVAKDLKPPVGVPLEAPRHILPVTSDIAELLPHRGLTTTTGLAAAPIGSTSLLWRLLAGPTAAGAWCAVIGLPGLHPLAARAAGVDLARLALVDAEGHEIAEAAAALADGLAALVVPSGAVTATQARRLTVRARSSGASLIWWQTRPVPGVDTRLEVTSTRWQGLRPNTGRRYGAGRLTACELDVAARWRTGVVRRASLWPYGGDRTGVVPLRSRP